MTSPKYILIEFNELSPRLIDRFMAEGRLPHFKKFFDSASVYRTTSEARRELLEPWIQWLSIHSGMTYDEHQVFFLGDGKKLKEECFAQCLSDAGVRVGVFGAMNTNYSRLNGYFVPDPWDMEGKPTPDWLLPFWQVVSKQVQESSKGTLGKTDAIRLANFMAKNGLRFKTLLAILRQLGSEVADSGLKWRRSALLDQLNYDLFCSLNRRFNVEFATFFSNSTAHLQHYYWRNFEPELFDTLPADSEHASLSTAIPFGYERHDLLLGRFLCDYSDSKLILCTGLSQQPWGETHKCLYRPNDFREFLEWVGVGKCEVKPVMAQQFHLVFASEGEAGRAEDILRSLRVDDESVMYVVRQGSSLFTGCQIEDARRASGELLNGANSIPFLKLFYQIHGKRSGRHHPEGALWIREGCHRIASHSVGITQLAPTFLSWFDVTPPAHMRAAPLN